MPAARAIGIAAALLLGSVAVAGGAPIVSVDAEALTRGVQPSTTTPLGDKVYVEIVIEGVDMPEVAAFELRLDFAADVLAFDQAFNGDFLQNPFWFIVTPEAGSIHIDATIRSFGGGASGDGRLARIDFDSIGVGASGLILSEVLPFRPLSYLV